MENHGKSSKLDEERTTPGSKTILDPSDHFEALAELLVSKEEVSQNGLLQNVDGLRKRKSQLIHRTLGSLSFPSCFKRTSSSC